MSQYQFTKAEVNALFPECQSYGDLFRAFEKKLAEREEVVCQFSINGLALTEENEKKLQGTDLSELATLIVEAQQPNLLLSGLLKNWLKEIPHMLSANDQLAQELRFESMEGRLKKFVDLIDGCQLLVESLMSLDTMISDSQVVKGPSWLQAQKQMAEGIGEALQSFQKKDFAVLCDVLEYDLGHSLQTWKNILHELLKEIESGNLAQRNFFGQTSDGSVGVRVANSPVGGTPPGK